MKSKSERRRKYISGKTNSLCERKKPDTFGDPTIREKRTSGRDGAGAGRRRRLRSPGPSRPG